MGDRDVEEEKGATQVETKIWPLTILSASLRDRLHAGIAKKGDKKLQDGSVPRGGRTAPKRDADHEVIRQELTAAKLTESVRGGRRRGETEAEPGGQAKIIIG
jgi:hypothetical protein